MRISAEKARRLERVARLYYEQGQTQEEVAKSLKVSRPLVSRMLAEAREAGIVEIRVRSLARGDSPLLGRIRAAFGLAGGLLLPDEADNNLTNQALAASTVDFIDGLGGGRLGLGWGHFIGLVVRLLESRQPQKTRLTDVCPMVGNSSISIRNYHSNENVRIVACQTLAAPHYLHTPAFAETRQELDLWRQTENYKAVRRQWEQLDVALVNIGNHPSTPDFASSARYGDLLAARQAVGRLIAYYFNLKGEIITSDFDYAVQIPLELLARSRKVVGICSANVSAPALAGALKTGLLTHLIAREEAVREALTLV